MQEESSRRMTPLSFLFKAASGEPPHVATPLRRGSGKDHTEVRKKLWHAVVDKVTVYNDDRLVYSLKDGSEITVML